ncbi:hypothetical protein GWE18_36785 [Bradyrhizobium sp. CSA112]|uniref:hypothetical protein n=1 Tax=Bradyrhizobium sp. CSA112 TaxID=2699170 RepID=UPI0023B0AD94|nr:hypothetical protein [Bradyrhizobium sp. CSA112]MDE5458265.1 hypothetical protein [Bradyrhizobium sp. CSA112]
MPDQAVLLQALHYSTAVSDKVGELVLAWLDAEAFRKLLHIAVHCDEDGIVKLMAYRTPRHPRHFRVRDRGRKLLRDHA